MVSEKKLPVRKIVSMSSEMAKAIDDYRFDKRIKSEAEAVRLLIEAGLKAEVVNNG